MRRLLPCLVLVLSTLAAPRHATAAVTDFYATVDSAEINKRDSSFGSNATLTVRGILAGASTPTTATYVFTSSLGLEGLETAMHCHRLATVVMSKPGKLQFAIGPAFPSLASGCKLTVATP